MKENINKTVKQLNKAYLIVIITLIVLLLAVMFGLNSFIAENTGSSVIAERYAIGLTLIAIPLSLKLFADKTKKITASENDNDVKIRQFKNAFIVRLSVLGVVGLVNTLFYAFMQNSNFMWLAVITFLTFSFCRTSADELNSLIVEKETSTEETENE